MTRRGLIAFLAAAAVCLEVCLAAPLGTGEGDNVASFLETSWGGAGQVSCGLCMESMKTTLGFCKDNGGRSVNERDQVVSLCAHIGEEEMKKDDAKNGCSVDSVLTRSRARIINKKEQCLIVYEGMMALYSPFDPCTQVRNVVNKPFSVCQSPKVDCNKSLDDLYMPASYPWDDKLAFPKGLPPLTCPSYVALISSECAANKRADFYHRSNLAAFCNKTFHGEPYQMAGCQRVVAAMHNVDTRMDLCSSLHAAPIDPVLHPTYCNASLSIPPTGPVSTPEYEAHFANVRAYYEAWNEPIPPEYLKGYNPDASEPVDEEPEEEQPVVADTNTTAPPATNETEVIEVDEE